MSVSTMSFMIFTAGLFDTMLGSNVIPSKQEQATLLTNVQEVFDQLQLLVNIETNATDESVMRDINRAVQGAKDKLELIQELSFTKLSCRSNNVCHLEYKQIIAEAVEEGTNELERCISEGSENVISNSCSLKNSTAYATNLGQNLLETLHNCSRKSGIHAMACYKNVISSDVTRVKIMILAAIEAHKKGHFRTIEIRTTADDCVDQVFSKYQNRIEGALETALYCT